MDNRRASAVLTCFATRYENLGVHYTLTVLACIAAVMVSLTASPLTKRHIFTPSLVANSTLTFISFAGTDTVSLLQIRPQNQAEE